MSTNWAEENLVVIRTLMERSTLYRRALAPIGITVGSLGVVAAVGGTTLALERPRPFIAYWAAVCALAGVVALVLARREALQEREPFWSPPTRRVALALAPALVAGALFSA